MNRPIVILLTAVAFSSAASAAQTVKELRDAGDLRGLVLKLADHRAQVRRQAAVALPEVVGKIKVKLRRLAITSFCCNESTYVSAWPTLVLPLIRITLIANLKAKSKPSYLPSKTYLRSNIQRATWIRLSRARIKCNFLAIY